MNLGSSACLSAGIAPTHPDSLVFGERLVGFSRLPKEGLYSQALALGVLGEIRVASSRSIYKSSIQASHTGSVRKGLQLASSYWEDSKIELSLHLRA